MVRSDDGRNVPVVQAFAFGKYLGYLKVTFDEAGNVVEAKGNPILMDSSIPQGNWPTGCPRFIFYKRQNGQQDTFILSAYLEKCLSAFVCQLSGSFSIRENTLRQDNFMVLSCFDFNNFVCNSGFHHPISHPDPGVLADIKEWRKSLANYSSQYVGQTLVYLNGTFKECRYRECNLGNLICDAMVRVTLSTVHFHNCVLKPSLPGKERKSSQ